MKNYGSKKKNRRAKYKERQLRRMRREWRAVINERRMENGLLPLKEE